MWAADAVRSMNERSSRYGASSVRGHFLPSMTRAGCQKVKNTCLPLLLIELQNNSDWNAKAGSLAEKKNGRVSIRFWTPPASGERHGVKGDHRTTTAGEF